jgi:hypothetical protein
MADKKVQVSKKMIKQAIKVKSGIKAGPMSNSG